MAGCAHPPAALHVAPANPFAMLKSSAVCTVSPAHKAADGSVTVDMKVRSDDGLCAVSLQTDKGTAYPSFGVTTAPEHGKVFIYNYDDHTLVTFTPTMAYAGADVFNATLIQGSGQPRVHLRVTASVDATGVVVPKPIVPAVTAPVPATKGKARTTAHSTRKTATKH